MILLVFFWAGSSSAHVVGLNPTGLAGSLAQTSDHVGHCCGCMRELFTHALHSAEVISFISAQLKMQMQKILGEKRHDLPGLLAILFFSVLRYLRSSDVFLCLCSFRFVLLSFLFSPSPLLCFSFPFFHSDERMKEKPPLFSPVICVVLSSRCLSLFFPFPCPLSFSLFCLPLSFFSPPPLGL